MRRRLPPPVQAVGLLDDAPAAHEDSHFAGPNWGADAASHGNLVTKCVFRVRFEVPGGTRHVTWAKSKRLMYGSLLCLTADNFATDQLLWATVANRDGEEMDKSGVLQIDLMWALPVRRRLALWRAGLRLHSRVSNAKVAT